MPSLKPPRWVLIRSFFGVNKTRHSSIDEKGSLKLQSYTSCGNLSREVNQRRQLPYLETNSTDEISGGHSLLLESPVNMVPGIWLQHDKPLVLFLAPL